jgi:hypothetical protein
MRAQHDLDVNRAWQTFQDLKPKGTYSDFERSDLYKDLLNNFDKKLATAFSVQPPKTSVGVNDMKVRRLQPAGQ